MDGKQLDLLDWKPACTVHAFPLFARRDKVRAVAENLLRKHGNAARTYWKQTASTLGNQLLRIGVSPAEIEQDLCLFFDAVQTEMVRLSSQHYGGIA